MAQRRRRWFQLSLTTCLVLMVVAGMLVWANVGPAKFKIARKGVYTFKSPQASVRRAGKVAKIQGPGWPFSSYALTHQLDPPHTVQDPLADLEVRWGKNKVHRQRPFTLAANTLVGLLILVLLSMVCEALIRRRERRRLEGQT